VRSRKRGTQSNRATLLRANARGTVWFSVANMVALATQSEA